jgi:hypothetical protein
VVEELMSDNKHEFVYLPVTTLQKWLEINRVFNVSNVGEKLQKREEKINKFPFRGAIL